MKLQQLQEAKEDYIHQHQGEQLMTAYYKDIGQKPPLHYPEDVLKELSKINRQYLQWVVNRYLNKEFKLEDSSRIKDELVKFQAVRTKLPQNQRDLNRMTLRDLYAVLAPYEEKEVISNKEADRRYKQKLFDSGDAELFYKDSQITVITPRTVEASCYFGKNTKWCTAAKKDNMFEEYTEDGPLYIIMTHDGKKYQFWFGGIVFNDEYFEASYQFMDELDTEVNIRKLADIYPSIKKAFKKIALQNGVLDLVDNITIHLCKKLVNKDEKFYAIIPDEFKKDYRLSVNAVIADERLIYHIPDEYHTYQFFEDVCKMNPYVLDVADGFISKSEIDKLAHKYY